MNKKASIQDIIFNITLLLSLAFTITLVYIIVHGFNEAWQANANVPVESKNALGTLVLNWPALFDWIFILALVTLCIGLIIVGSRLQADPKFLPIYIVMGIVVLLCSVFFANFWGDFTENPAVSAYTGQYPKMNWVFEHFVLVVLFMVILSGVVIYGNPGNIGGSL